VKDMWKLKVKGENYNVLNFKCKHLDVAADLVGMMKKNSVSHLTFELEYEENCEVETEEGEE
jgi:hypothetical protein